MQRLIKGKAQALLKARDSFNSGFVVCFTKHTIAECVTYDTSHHPSTTRERPAATEVWVSLLAF